MVPAFMMSISWGETETLAGQTIYSSNSRDCRVVVGGLPLDWVVRELRDEPAK